MWANHEEMNIESSNEIEEEKNRQRIMNVTQRSNYKWDSEFTNGLTKFHQNYNNAEVGKYMCKYYLWEADKMNKHTDGNIYIVFRSPGSTRGCIRIDEDRIIQDIIFYKDTLNLVGNYKEFANNYIGVKLEILK